MNDLETKLCAVLQSGPPLRIAILFGSRARGTARPDSDIDVALLPADTTLSLADALPVRLERASGLAVDLVRIDHADEALRWRIARDGRVLLSEPAHAASRFLAREGIEHDERSSLEADAIQRYRAALAREGRP